MGVRPDGYHLLEAEMATVDLADELEIEAGTDGLEVLEAVSWVLDRGPLSTGRRPGGVTAAPAAVPLGSENLVSRALAAVDRRARVRLLKRIPAGAGLGGGSADAAAVLRWAGVLDPAVAARLGADVPFCVVGGRALVTGVGEVVEPLDFEAFTAVLVTPELTVPTPEVYRAWDALGGPVGEHGNDLEPAAVVVEPQLRWWRDMIAAVAGSEPLLAGSGGTWYLEREPEAAGRLAVELQGAVRAEARQALVVAVSSTAHL